MNFINLSEARTMSTKPCNGVLPDTRPFSPPQAVKGLARETSLGCGWQLHRRVLMAAMYGIVPKPTSALFRVDEPESKVEFRNESGVPETKVEFPKRSSRNQSRSSRNEVPKRKFGTRQ